MTDAKNIRQYMNLMEAGPAIASDYVGPKASDSISYAAELSGGKISKIVATLNSHDSARYTKLGRNLLRIETLEKEVKTLKAETKQEARELVADLFHAEDAVCTRVVDTVSFTFEMTKDPKATETYKYAEILKELQEHLTPELITMLEALKEKHKSTTQKAASLKTTDKAAESINEGFGDKLKAFFSTLKDKVLAWAKSYDKKLDALKAQAGMI